jgi:hypothetical protein
MANDAPHVVMVAHEENLQDPRLGAEEESHFQARPAFKYILP